MRTRAIASRYHRGGATGIYVFNWHGDRNTRRELLTQIGAVETLQATDKVYAATHRFIQKEGQWRGAFRNDRIWGEVPAPLSSADGYAELVRRWLARFGPGTETDLVWWLGATKGAVRAALAEVGAVEVSLESGAPAYLLPDDVEPVDPVEPWAALLPVLDPTVMGWKERAFHLGEHGPALFDRNGNAGTTAWWDGRVVGCWVQDDDATVAVRLLEDVPAAGREALRGEAARLTAWLAGERVGTVYPSPAMRCDPGDLTYPVLRA